ncbi:GntR family transcriptional regulator [Pseudonocardia eucalypti]|uniref:GntR family transcriptional regulator n=1 Tax=Pseudonocardia eucalypti TaxID=648755 RepID=A0ABP9QL01_9PSEU|nr:DNA-binding GntR family transcriptional regulator [Pseudonocardia eucalypti]
MLVHDNPPTRSLAETAYREIRDLLVTVRIRPGAPLSEEQLTRQLGMGRTPVREAIKRLEAERLVVVYPRRGMFATEIHLSDLELLTAVRAPLEGEAAFHAARRLFRADRERLRALRDEAGHCAAGAAAEIDLDSRVHRAIYDAAHNPYLAATLEQYYNLILRIWHFGLDRLPEVTSHIAELVPLLDAVLAGAADQARALAVEHVVSFQREVSAAL